MSTTSAPSPFVDSKARPVSAPRGPELTCANWQIEAALRMLQNNHVFEF